MVDAIITGGLTLANSGNHFLDVLAFTPMGIPAFPTAAGQVLLTASSEKGPIPVYSPLISFLTSTPPFGLGRPLNTGANGVFLFGYDWRDGINVQATALSAFVDSVLRATGAPKVVLLTHSLGGPIARAYYLSSTTNAAKVDQVISIAGGFNGVPFPLKILAMGDEWVDTFSFLFWELSIDEWETQSLAQNWPTAYFQQPNSDLWFFDHGATTASGATIDRRYIRELRTTQAMPSTTVASHQSWVARNHNAALMSAAASFFAPLPTQMGDFVNGTGDIFHHRIFSRGHRTVVGVQLTEDADIGGKYSRKQAIQGDGDKTVPYHGHLGKTALSDDRTYVLVNGAPNAGDVRHLPLANNSNTFSLLSGMLDGTLCTQPQAAELGLGFLSHKDVVEDHTQTLVDGDTEYEQLPSDRIP
jgi:pimeloyl-ACP methyl ester carboxylesterase